jgi:hypothetical protein
LEGVAYLANVKREPMGEEWGRALEGVAYLAELK